jgi:uncharacterized repeat protein (TIGR03803 family)
VVFKVSPAGTETVLYSFTGGADGGAPGSGVIQDTQGNLYGSTNQGGAESSLCIGGHCGVVFKLSPTGIETVLHTFTGTYGANPVRLARDVAGNLYGGTSAGGPYGGDFYHSGVLFEFTPCDSAYEFRILYSFTGGADGGGASGLVRDAAGNLYGMAGYGGASSGVSGHGVVFRLAP